MEDMKVVVDEFRKGLGLVWWPSFIYFFSSLFNII